MGDVLQVLRASGPVPRQNVGPSSCASVTVAENCGVSAVAWGRAMLCSTVATLSASVQRRLLEVFQVFYVSG